MPYSIYEVLHLCLKIKIKAYLNNHHKRTLFQTMYNELTQVKNKVDYRP